MMINSKDCPSKYSPMSKKSHKAETTIEETQQELINNSKLKLLQKELRIKFIEIRELYYSGNKNKKRVQLFGH